MAVYQDNPQSKARFDQLIASGGYPGWDKGSAYQDFLATGAGNQYQNVGQGPSNGIQTTGNPQQDINKAIQDSFQRLQTELVSKYNQYKGDHPFNLDQVLADKAVQAKEQIDPYYNETLTNYLTGVTRQMDRSTQDAQNLLTQLNADTQSYTGNSALKLNEAIQRSQQGYADAGLFNSGAQAQDTGLLKVGANQDMTDYLRNQQFKQTGIQNSLSRTVEDLTSAKTQQTRDLARQQYTDVQQRTGDLTKEAGQQYVSGFKATLPPELQAQSGFDIMKDIGIYN